MIRIKYKPIHHEFQNPFPMSTRLELIYYVWELVELENKQFHIIQLECIHPDVIRMI